MVIFPSFRTMSKGKKNSKQSSRMQTVEETNAALAKELAEDAQKERESLPTSGDTNAPKVLSPKAPSVDNQTGSNVSTEPELGSDGRSLLEPAGSIFPTDSHESDKIAKKLLTSLQHEMNSRFHDRSLLLQDLQELGMVRDFSHDERYISLPYEDAQRLVTTMRMATKPIRFRTEPVRTHILLQYSRLIYNQ